MPASLFANLGKSSTTVLWYVLLLVVLPAITLIIGGLIYFWQNNLLLLITAGWLVIAALAYGVFIYWPSVKATRQATNATGLNDGQDHKHDNEALPLRLDTPSYWSNQDIEVWDQCCMAMNDQLIQQPDWREMPDLALAQLALVSEHYNKTSNNASLQFTVPELLLVISVASSRYRLLVIEYVPYIDKISVANVNRIVNSKDSIKTGYSWFNRIRRTVRLINPTSAVIGELRDLVSNEVFSKASSALQSDMKRMLLQEITQVGIDLYSGKLKVSDYELTHYRSQVSQNDKHRQFEVAEPVRIVLIGQSSSGKSSLINGLTKTLQAEVGVLPVTNRLTVHELQLDETTCVNLVDTPGIDSSDDTTRLLIEQALEADLIIWTAKATQPARAPDHEVYSKLQSAWEEQPERLQAPMIMALTHIDQLSPKGLWQPPFDLSSNEPKALAILAATESARTRIGFADSVLSVPLYLGEQHEHYNTDALAAQIMLLTEKSLNVQRNRRRIELGSNAPNWHSRWLQAKKLGKVIGQSVVKRI